MFIINEKVIFFNVILNEANIYEQVMNIIVYIIKIRDILKYFNLIRGADLPVSARAKLLLKGHVVAIRL
jgi:hypothetical protein